MVYMYYLCAIVLHLRQHILKGIAGLLLLVLFFGVMPKEGLHHLMYEEEDVVHPNYKPGEYAFTEKHHHCGFLVLQFEPYIAEEPLFLVFAPEIEHAVSYSCFYSSHYYNRHTAVSLRGPPTSLMV